MGNLNPPWNGDQSEEASNAHFQKAMQLTGHEFSDALEYYSNVKSASTSSLTMSHHLENVLRHTVSSCTKSAMPQIAVLLARFLLPADIVQKVGFVNPPGIPCGVCVAIIGCL